tara:strand:+ start:43 stop:234 length:192 start_codon:yes stop_codon:yes gene_type:complete
MNLKNPQIKKTIALGDGTIMEVELSESVINAIKKEYSVDDIKDTHIETFFEDVLADSIRKVNT